MEKEISKKGDRVQVERLILMQNHIKELLRKWIIMVIT